MKEVTVTARTATRPNGPGTRGILYVHSAPSALCPHIEWAVGGVLGVPVSLDWTPQAAQSGTYRAELGMLTRRSLQVAAALTAYCGGRALGTEYGGESVMEMIRPCRDGSTDTSAPNPRSMRSL